MKYSVQFTPEKDYIHEKNTTKGGLSYISSLAIISYLDKERNHLYRPSNNNKSIKRSPASGRTRRSSLCTRPWWTWDPSHRCPVPWSWQSCSYSWLARLDPETDQTGQTNETIWDALKLTKYSDFHCEGNTLTLHKRVHTRTLFHDTYGIYFTRVRYIALRTHRSRDDQRELAVTVVVVHRFSEDESGSVTGFQREFPLLVAFHYRVVHVAVRRVRLVPVDRVDPAKHRHACD